MRTDEYYQLLGVGCGASRDTLKRAFRSRLFSTHPDLHPEDGLAAERTRQIVEAYRALSSPASRSIPELATTPIDRTVDVVYEEPVITSGGAARLFAAICVLAVVIYMAFGAARNVSGGSDMVFRPDPSALTNWVEVKLFPLVVEPGLMDCVQWYHAQQYQLSLAGDWATQETIKAYELAEQRAAMRKDSAAARFYRTAIEHIRRERRSSPINPRWSHAS